METDPKAKSSYRTLELQPHAGEMIKPAELIDITGDRNLTLSARRLYNVLVAHSFGEDMGKIGFEWSIPLSALKGTHRGNDRIEDSLIALMRTIVRVRLPDGRTRRVALLGGNDMGEPGRPHGALTYSFDRRLVPLLRESTVFGKLELAVMHAFTTKYALALYEAIARRVRLQHVFSEIFTLDELRELLGVPEGKLSTYGNLNKYAIQPAAMEINAMAAFGVKVYPMKEGRKVVRIRIGWWQKSVDELKASYEEVKRPREGRKGRIKRGTEYIVDLEQLTLPAME